MKIRQLPERLANQIAAGEVVERPSSVVKELLENSIDAGSNTIKIELQEAGLALIKVTDDGHGISERDVKNAFLRHATSKIQYDTDLFHIKTLGFRGEALSSISSVSKLTIKTSLGDAAGTKLYLEGGKVIDESKSDARKGTEITVEELFFNTPARLKYMKSIHTELSHITDLINRYALAQPHIRFEVIHNRKLIFSAVGNDNRLQAIGQIYGMQIARSMYEVHASSLDFDITGFIAKPEATRSNRNYMTFIINGRYIKSPALSFAVMRAYDTLLPKHRYPIVVLAITLDPILIDVNVHPTKLEVRLSKEKELVALMEDMIRKQFRQARLIPEAVEQTSAKAKEKVKTSQDAFDFTSQTAHIPPERPRQINSRIDDEKVSEPFPALIQDKPVTKPRGEAVNLQSDSTESDLGMITDQAATENRIPSLYPIGQLQGTYILAQNEDGFYMIDQHAAQERIKYEYFKAKLGKPISELQDLLLPMTFDFTLDEVILIEKEQAKLEEIGLFLERFGEQTFAIRAFPNWFPKGLEETIVEDMIDQVIKHGKVSVEKQREEVAILMSCKQSIKANHYLNETEMNRLLNDLSKTTDPFTCPHGRPVIIHFSTYEIEKMFKRVM